MLSRDVEICTVWLKCFHHNKMCTLFTKNNCFKFLYKALFTAGKRPTNYHQVFCLLPFMASSTPTPCSYTQMHQIYPCLTPPHTLTDALTFAMHPVGVFQHTCTHKCLHTQTLTHTNIPTRSAETVCEETTGRERWRSPGIHSCWLLQEKRGARRLLPAPLTTALTQIHTFYKNCESHT